MLQYGREAVALAAGVERDQYERDRTLQLALAYLLQIVGEAARHVSDVLRTATPEIPWKQVAGMRNRLVHDYPNVSYAVVWEIVHDELPTLITALEKITPPEPPA
jgi:uncharacterized protein with HEPN domain